MFLSKNDINPVLKSPFANFWRFITQQHHPRHVRCVAWHTKVHAVLNF